MARLSLKKLLFAIVLGALFATLQGESPFPALKLSKLSPATCSSQPTPNC